MLPSLVTTISAHQLASNKRGRGINLHADSTLQTFTPYDVVDNSGRVHVSDDLPAGHDNDDDDSNSFGVDVDFENNDGIDVANNNTQDSVEQTLFNACMKRSVAVKSAAMEALRYHIDHNAIVSLMQILERGK